MQIVDAIQSIARGCESVQAVMNTSGKESENRFRLAIESLNRLAMEQGIPIAIIGGLGAIRYGYPAATEDIDILVSKIDLERLIHHASEYDFRVVWQAASGWHTLSYRDVEINVVPQGSRAKNSSPTLIPSPMEVGVSQGVGYASLEGWMELKLSTARQKDKAHIVEVLKKCDSGDVVKIRKHIHSIHPTYEALLEELIVAANEEAENEKDRGHNR
ncbi:MAG: hypothetical protein ACK52L_02850 [Pirellula sp.]|jgi:hypothetical protein